MYQVKNIDNSNWREYKYMVIRDCSDEQAPNNGFWYWGSYNDLAVAHQEANELCNGVLVETVNVEPIDRWL